MGHDLFSLCLAGGKTKSINAALKKDLRIVKRAWKHMKDTGHHVTPFCGARRKCCNSFKQCKNSIFAVSRQEKQLWPIPASLVHSGYTYQLCTVTQGCVSVFCLLLKDRQKRGLKSRRSLPRLLASPGQLHSACTATFGGVIKWESHSMSDKPAQNYTCLSTRLW